MPEIFRIGTRDSQLAVWQASLVQDLLKENGFNSELVYIKSEGDIDTVTPLYALGVQGVFTRTLDAALLSKRIDLAVHSMKDVPTQMAQGLKLAAVLNRASYKDLLVYKNESDLEKLGFNNGEWSARTPLSTLRFTIATSSIRRIAQWLHRYPEHQIENLRGNVNTRLRKLDEHNWNGAIFAAAGLERIQLRPKNSVELDWMLPAPAQGAIMIACREEDEKTAAACALLNDEATSLCTKIERDFLNTLHGGCSTPISALAQLKDGKIWLQGNIISMDGKEKLSIEKKIARAEASNLGMQAADEILSGGGQSIMDSIRKNNYSSHDEV